MQTKVCVLDYGAGNVTSVANMFSRFSETKVSNLRQDILDATHLVLPGVGSFGASMKRIHEVLPLDLIYSQISLGKPILGICVGMQVFAEKGIEFGLHSGLSLMKGEIAELETGGLRLPHVGWNSLENIKGHPIVNGITTDDDFYFVHSFAFRSIPDEFVIAEAMYGINFPAIVGIENVIGVQFHPEKSQSSGTRLVRNYLEIE